MAKMNPLGNHLKLSRQKLIESIRAELIKEVRLKGLLHPDTLYKSKLLDIMINDIQKTKHT